MAGFFSPVEALQKTPQSLIPKCGACGLHKTCRSPKMGVDGEGRKGILIVGEAPGADEDDQGVPFVGRAGGLLSQTLRSFGIEMREDCWITNSLICRPPKNRTPEANEIDYCRPNLLKVIAEKKPTVIVPLGASAVRSVIGHVWKEAPGAMSRWAGWQIPEQSMNCWVCPTYHPSDVLRNEGKGEGKVSKLWFSRHLEQISRISGPPYEEVPRYLDYVDLYFDPANAAKRIDQWIAAGGAVAFDYETNRLKPDRKGAEIVSCAVCWKGKETISFPWVGPVIPAMSRLLRSNLPKIGANTKFEDRWTRAILGHPVENWTWDSMLGAHACDNRREITSVKFQAFVRFGVPDYSWSVSSLLSDADADGFNRIREIPLTTLLEYNGLDAVLEYMLATDQRREICSK